MTGWLVLKWAELPGWLFKNIISREVLYENNFG
jgi:hypothetical protein